MEAHAKWSFKSRVAGDGSGPRGPGSRGRDPWSNCAHRNSTSRDSTEPRPARADRPVTRHGLVFHLASDRNIVDDLWANVAAHMRACRFGIAFFEARTEKGLNYNLNIEVGSCLVLGRRMALLKDHSLASMPTDLAGHIYFSVDLDDPATVAQALEQWIQKSLGLWSQT